MSNVHANEIRGGATSVLMTAGCNVGLGGDDGYKPPEQSTICDQCGKGFDNARSLRTHIRKSHNQTKAYPCDACDKVFFHKDKFVGHKMTVHLKLRPFKCKHCEYSSAARSTIYRHCEKRHGQRGRYLIEMFYVYYVV